MSSDIIDVEVNVVSSPELSRSGSVDRQSLHSPQPPPVGSAIGGGLAESQKRDSVSHGGSQISNNSTSVNISVHHQLPPAPAAPHSYHPPSAHHQLSNHHLHSSNSAESNRAMSPSSKTTTKSDQKKTTTTPGYTSFSISSILSRNEPKKDVFPTTLPLLPLHHSPDDLHNTAMFSR